MIALLALFGCSGAEILTTADGLEFVRTPEADLEGLTDYDFAANYAELDGLRLHYLDEGPPEGEVVVLLHGDPGWSYLNRSVASALADQGLRVIAPDWIGAGRSDKPLDESVHTTAQHVAWLGDLVDALALDDVTLVAHDRAGWIGLRLVAERPERFARVVAMNAAPPARIAEIDAEGELDLRPSEVAQAGVERTLSEGERAAWDAPWPSETHEAARRAFPAMLAQDSDADRAAWDALGALEIPLLALWGALDPELGDAETQDALTGQVPGAEGRYHQRFDAGRFLQEDEGPALAATIAYFIQGTPLGVGACWVPEETESALDCAAVCSRLSDCDPEHLYGLCEQSCELVSPYLTEAASAGVSPCMLESECGTFETFGDALDTCMVGLIAGGELTAPESSLAVCDAVGDAVAACDPDARFGQICGSLAAVFPESVISEFAACEAAPCGEMRSCLIEANCTLLYDDIGALPE